MASPGLSPSVTGETSLALLVERLHPALVDVVVAPHGADVAVRDAVIFDASEPVLDATGSVVLAVGVDTVRGRVAMLHGLEPAGVIAVIVKRPDADDPAIVRAASDTGIAVLSAPAEASWGQLYSTVVTATMPLSVDTPRAPLGDLFALANAVAAMVGGATTIEDPHNRVLAYSSLDHGIDVPRQETILGRAVPSSWQQRLHETGIFKRLWQTDGVVRIDDVLDEPENLPRLAVAVRAGGEPLGSIWVIDADRHLGADAERTLREAADIAAMHLLRHRSAQDVDRHRRSEALLAVLERRDSGDRLAVALGADGTRRVAVVGFDLGPVTESESLVQGQRVADLVAASCESYRRRAACVASGNRCYAVIPNASGDDDQIAALVASIVSRAGESLRVSLRAGIGSTVRLHDVAESRVEADQVLDVLVEESDRPVARLVDVRPRVILRRLRDLATDDPGLRAGKLAAMVEQDTVKGTSWISTLRAYFDAFGDMTKAAAAVNVHPNTFRYRLRRITEVFGVDLADPDERLVTELQLRFLRDTGHDVWAATAMMTPLGT